MATWEDSGQGRPRSPGRRGRSPSSPGVARASRRPPRSVPAPCRRSPRRALCTEPRARPGNSSPRPPVSRNWGSPAADGSSPDRYLDRQASRLLRVSDSPQDCSLVFRLCMGDALHYGGETAPGEAHVPGEAERRQTMEGRGELDELGGLRQVAGMLYLGHQLNWHAAASESGGRRQRCGPA